MIKRNWTFRFEQRDGACLLSIPDKGGMTDMLPEEPEQQAWVVSKLQGIAGVEETWPTTWKLDAAAEKTVRALLAAEGVIVDG